MTEMDTLPRGDSPPSPRLDSQMYLHENVTEAAQKMSPEEWSELPKTTGFVHFVSLIWAVSGVVASLEIMKELESYCCINEHEPHLHDANLSNLPEYSCSSQAMEMLLNLSALLLFTTATEGFAGIVLIEEVLERSQVLLELWVLVTIFWMTAYIKTSVFLMSHHITPIMFRMILEPAFIITGFVALCAVLLYWGQILSQEVEKNCLGKHGKNQAHKNRDREESSNEPSVPFLKSVREIQTHKCMSSCCKGWKLFL